MKILKEFIAICKILLFVAIMSTVAGFGYASMRNVAAVPNADAVAAAAKAEADYIRAQNAGRPIGMAGAAWEMKNLDKMVIK